MVSSFISIFEGNQQLHLQSRSAVTTPEHIRLADILERLLLHHRCLGHAPTHVCQAWYERIPLPPQGYIPGRSGYGIVLQVRPRPPPNVVFTDIDDPVLLQLDHLIPHHPLQLREDVEVPEKLVPVRLQSGQNDLQVPSFLEIRTDGDWCS